MSGHPKILAAGVAAAATAVGAYYWYRSKSAEVPPSKWRYVGILDEINIYPVKSCAGIELESVKCDNLGIHLEEYIDRRFMLVDIDHKLVSARTYPKMLKIQPRITGNILKLAAPGMNELEIDLDCFKNGKRIKANLWGADVQVIECGRDYNEWFSKFILNTDEGIKLVYYPYEHPSRSKVREGFRNGIFTKHDTGALQDISSYMLINETSVEDLNTRLERKVHSKQFRGTFLISTSGPAYEEDKWEWIKIGKDAVFRNISPCYRCIFPNIDPFTAERDPDGEPLKTLKTYRVWGEMKSPRLGSQLGLRIPGTVKQGDKVYVNDE